VILNESESSDVISECLWIFTNLACEVGVTEYLIQHMDLLKTIEALLLSNFLSGPNGMVTDMASLQ